MLEVRVIILIFLALIIISAVPIISLKYHSDLYEYSDIISKNCYKNTDDTDGIASDEKYTYLYKISDFLYGYEYVKDMEDMWKENYNKNHPGSNWETLSKQELEKQSLIFKKGDDPHKMPVWKQYLDYATGTLVIIWVGLLLYLFLFIIYYSKEYVVFSLLSFLFVWVALFTIIYSLIMKKITEIYNDTNVLDYVHLINKIKQMTGQNDIGNVEQQFKLFQNQLYEKGDTIETYSKYYNADDIRRILTMIEKEHTSMKNKVSIPTPHYDVCNTLFDKYKAGVFNNMKSNINMSAIANTITTIDTNILTLFIDSCSSLLANPLESDSDLLKYFNNPDTIDTKLRDVIKYVIDNKKIFQNILIIAHYTSTEIQHDMILLHDKTYETLLQHNAFRAMITDDFILKNIKMIEDFYKHQSRYQSIMNDTSRIIKETFINAQNIQNTYAEVLKKDNIKTDKDFLEKIIFKDGTGLKQKIVDICNYFISEVNKINFNIDNITSKYLQEKLPNIIVDKYAYIYNFIQTNKKELQNIMILLHNIASNIVQNGLYVDEIYNQFAQSVSDVNEDINIKIDRYQTIIIQYVFKYLNETLNPREKINQVFGELGKSIDNITNTNRFFEIIKNILISKTTEYVTSKVKWKLIGNSTDDKISVDKHSTEKRKMNITQNDVNNYYLYHDKESIDNIKYRINTVTSYLYAYILLIIVLLFMLHKTLNDYNVYAFIFTFYLLTILFYYIYMALR